MPVLEFKPTSKTAALIRQAKIRRMMSERPPGYERKSKLRWSPSQKTRNSKVEDFAPMPKDIAADLPRGAVVYIFVNDQLTEGVVIEPPTQAKSGLVTVHLASGVTLHKAESTTKGKMDIILEQIA